MLMVLVPQRAACLVEVLAMLFLELLAAALEAPLQLVHQVSTTHL